MFNHKPDSYWLNKVKLFCALHGGYDNFMRITFCYYCRHGHNAGKWGYECKKRNKFQSRMMFKNDFSELSLNPNADSQYTCGEWLKDV